MQTFLLKQNVLTDDVLKMPQENKVFKGNYIAILEYNVYLNPWQDRKIIRKFRSQKMLEKTLLKKYGKSLQELT